MDETPDAENDANQPQDESDSKADSQPQDAGLDATNSQATALLDEIRNHVAAAAQKSDDIEQGRHYAEQSRKELERQLAKAEELIAQLTTHEESIRLRAAELTALCTTSQTNNNHTVEAKAKAEADVQSINTFLNSITESASHATAAKISIEEAQATIATKSDHIEKAKLHADTVRADVDRFSAQAQQASANAEAQFQASRTTSDNLTNLFTAVQTTKATTDSEAAAVVNLRQQSEEHATKSKSLADIAEAAEARIMAYEARLKEFEDTAAARLATIDSLLPSAASAGLAHAFKKRRTYFKWLQGIWQFVFILSILALLGLAGLELHLFVQPDTALTWDKLGLSLLHRLPFALPLIWLAFHASHKAALLQRVDEDYAFKETVSRSFEGYRREMKELEGQAAPGSALARLCEGVLTIITNPPGRIYEKHQLIQTPFNAAAESLLPLAEQVAKATKITFELKAPS